MSEYTVYSENLMSPDEMLNYFAGWFCTK